MNCQELEENLPLLLYGELSPEEQAACDEHLAGCASCRAAREKLEQLHRVLAQRPRVEASPALLAEARMALDAALERRAARLARPLASRPAHAALSAGFRFCSGPHADPVRVWPGLGTAAARREADHRPCRE